MTVYQFPTPGYARRFARNARSRGMTAQVAGRLVTVSEHPQLALLAQSYAGLRIKGER